MWIRKAKNLEELPIRQRTMALQGNCQVSHRNMSKAVHLVKKETQEVDSGTNTGA
jgi:hypothetical protein